MKKFLARVHELPGELPEGEEILWQASPSPLQMAYSFHVRAVAVYFALLLVWQVVDGATMVAFARSAALSLAVVGLVLLYALLVAHTTSYTLTSRRLVVKTGIAMPLRYNIPYVRLESAGMRQARDGSGDIVLGLVPGGQRLGFIGLWPHVRPFRFARPAPMLRAVRDVATPAQLLARAVQAEPGAEMLRTGATGEGRERPSSPVHASAALAA